MNNFSFYCPTRVFFGRGESAKIAQEIPQNAKILLLYGGGSIKKNGVYDEIMGVLKGFEVAEFGGLEANPDFDTCLKARDYAKEIGANFLLAVGGGSVLDATKFIAQIYYEQKNEWDLLSLKRTATKALPIGAVMTLPATGSEMNCGGVISRRSTGEKRFFHNELVFPKFSVIDPTHSFTLPTRQIQNGIIDAFVHTIEQYATYDVNSPLQDSWAISVMKTLIDCGAKTIDEPENYEARANLCWAATCALNGWIACGVVEDWAVHMIGYELTAFYGLDHAKSLAVVLGARYKYSINSKREKLEKLGRELFGLSNLDGDLAQICIEKIVEFFEGLGVATHLEAYNIDANDAADKISARFKEHGAVFGENGEVTPSAVREILLASK